MALIRQVPEDHPLPDAPLCPVKVEAAEIISRRGLSDHVGPNGPRAMTLGKSISILWRDRSTDEFYQPHLQGCRFLSGGVDVGDSRKLDRRFESSARNMTRSQAGGVNEPCPVSDWNSLFAVEGHACIHDGFDLFSVGFVASHGAHKYGLGYTAKGSKVVGETTMSN